VEEEEEWVNDPDFLRKIGCVIPAHNSAEEITPVLEVRRVMMMMMMM
jgi:hypothetical protein